jgi:hypothetical protein
MKNRTSSPHITSLKANEIFVFGSNEGGAHGGGAAFTAMQWGARWGEAAGHQGHTYAIPTMDEQLKVLPLAKIKKYVDDFIELAQFRPDLIFLVTEIGCGIAGYTPEAIAPLFREAKNVENVHLPERFWEVLEKEG